MALSFARSLSIAPQGRVPIDFAIADMRDGQILGRWVVLSCCFQMLKPLKC
jgi:hypothetical protein